MSTHVSVVIPTRERSRTLTAALTSCVRQSYSNMSIIVSDNCSQDDTREVVSAFRDSRIRYVRTNKRVGMTENWEFALKQVDEGFVIYIGDDDALLPGAITEIVSALEKYGLLALKWAAGSWFWPNDNFPNLSHGLKLPLGTKTHTLRTPALLKRVLDMELCYTYLPMVYHGCVHTNLIDRARSDGGNFFGSRIPDIYAALAVASVTETHLFSERPFSISAISKYSTGYSHFIWPERKGTPAQAFDIESKLPFHPNFVFAPSFGILIAESWANICEKVDKAIPLQIDLKAVLIEALREANRSPDINRGLIEDAVIEMAQLNQINLKIKKCTSKAPLPTRDARIPSELQFVAFNIKSLELTDVFETSLCAKAILDTNPGDFFSIVKSVKKIRAIFLARFRMSQFNSWRRRIRNFFLKVYYTSATSL